MLLALLLASFQTLQAAAPLAGSVISNTAHATFFDADRGVNSALNSNTVRLIVQPLEALTLTPNNNIPRPAGSFAVLAHRLTNTGNSTSSYTLSYANQTGDNYDLQNLAMVWDQNGNGIADAGEPTLLSGVSFGPLAPGQSADLLVQGIVPGEAVVNNIARVGFTATTVLQAIKASAIDSVRVANGAIMQLRKSASNLTPKPGDTVTFSLAASNTGNLAATAVDVLVDALPKKLALLRDVIPANTTFSVLGPVGSAIALYHLQGQPELSFSSTPPIDLKTVDAIAFGFAAPLAAGQSISRSFDVKINANASAAINNIASMLFMDGFSTTAARTESNQVTLVLPAPPPAIRLYGSPNYIIETNVLTAGQPFYVSLDAAQCNLDPLKVEVHPVSITSQLTGDTENYVATETGLNTGVFRIEPKVPTIDGNTAPLVLRDGTLSVVKNDQISVVSLGCGATQVQANLLVDPFGVVFDSKTNVPVVGAVVTLIDVTGAGNGGKPGQPAIVFAADGITPAPSTVTTGADGRYNFPLVFPSIYRLSVVPPPNYNFVSTLAPSLLPAGRVIDAQGSYGGNFPVTIEGGAVNIDIPVDANPVGGLLVQKTVSRKTVELGEFVDYSIRVKNVTGQLLGRIQLTDRLPAGFAYQPGTARLNAGRVRLDGSTLPEPSGGIGPLLVFDLGSLEDHDKDPKDMVLSYRVRVGPGALQGDGVNRAQAKSGAPLAKVSNESTVAVQVLPGVFTDRSYLIGTVYADCNNNREQDREEPGIPGVRLYLEDGTHVITDARGKYSLYGLRPITHVLKLDRTTLPNGAGELALLANRNAGDAGSRFVDLKNGELHKADFAVQGCTTGLRGAIEQRATVANAADQVLLDRQAAQLTADTRAAQTALAKGAIASTAAGPVSNLIAATVDVTKPVRFGGGANVGQGANSVNDSLPTAGRSRPALTDEQMATMDNTLVILSPANGQVLDYAQTSVTVKGDISATLSLHVNGLAVPPTRIGKHSQLKSQQLQVIEYIGVDLKSGKNTFEVFQGAVAAGLGRPGSSRSIQVTAPGALARLLLSAPHTQLPADGRSLVRVTLDVQDADGVSVTSRTAITLEANLGLWKTPDLNPSEPGVQIFVEGGRTVLDFESPAQSGEVVLIAASGIVTTQTNLSFLPDLRPLIAAGIVEGVLNLRSLDSRALQPTRAQDGFEQELSRVGVGFENERGNGSARAALFLKGKVKGEYLLTLAYDSDKNTKERLFRDIQPGEFYPVYGDSSFKGFDAQSTSRLYVRVDKGRSHVLYGDFNTQAEVAPVNAAVTPDERRLGQYNRSLTGVKTQVESADGRGRVTGFASRASSRQIVDEQPARGVSGPYSVVRLPVVENSEKVEILTRDRNQPATVLKAVAMTRFVDYEINTLTGQILFRAPLPSLDAEFNPNSLRITYEVEQGGDPFWVTGVSASYQLSGTATVGAAIVRDNDPLKPLELQNVGLTAKLGAHTIVVAEVAQTQTPLAEQPRGQAARVEIRHDDGRVKAEARVVKADSGFDNPTANVTKGVEEASAKASYKLNDELFVKGEYLQSRDSATKVLREGALIGVDYALSEKSRVEFGLRQSRVSEQPAVAGSTPVPAQDTTSARIKLIGQIPGHPQASLFAEYEQDVENSTRSTAAVGGEYRHESGTRLYGRYEFISSLGTTYGLNEVQQRNATVFGIQTSTAKNANLFSEYRLRDAIAGREAEAAVGLRNRWQLSDGVRVNAGYERVQSLNGPGTNESTVLTGGVDYTGSPSWKGSARLEFRNSPTSDSVLGTVGGAYRIDEQWSALARNLASVIKNRDGTHKTEDWLQAGLAYRGLAPNRYNILLRTEYRYESAQALIATDATLRNVGIVSGHLNYQAKPELLLSGRVAAKWVGESSAGQTNHYNTQLLSARATYDLSKQFDLGLNAAALLGGNGRSHQWGLGAELGYLMADNLWLSLGYNAFGFTDKDLTGQDYTNKGVYLRLRWKFDENLFQDAAKP